MNIDAEIHALLGLCMEEKRVRSGLLAEGTMAQIRDAIARVLISRGIDATEAVKVPWALFWFSKFLKSLYQSDNAYAWGCSITVQVTAMLDIFLKTFPTLNAKIWNAKIRIHDAVH